jgi:hypothetical protein
LGIEETCTLQGNYYLLINEVWPATFGVHLYQRIQGHLDRMLLGTKDEWETSYSSAKSHLLNDVEKFQLWKISTRTLYIMLVSSSGK